ncbi:2-keto-4-pentenoate hydratase [Novosphingopyxis iocasae]|uniref:2-keto-4-pentenoate hydratase n=1 Tax=Novosphingopyxis iocasae TaxID=2762729 RepID=UPI001FE6C8C3|nr:2-keto-4-pentenoate hydratase [Novosphingopyxis iocasae]
MKLWDLSVGGWKVGRVGEPTATELGADRLVGPIFSNTIVEVGSAECSMPVFRDGFAAAEAEFMLRLASPDGRALPANNEEAMDWIDDIRIGIEIASSPYSDINRDGPCVTISDHGNNAGLILGQRVERDLWNDLNSIDVALGINGETVGEASVATMLDGPFGAARFLLANLHARGIEPQPGWWISSGAITGVHEVCPDDRIVAHFGSVGEVACRIGP